MQNENGKGGSGPMKGLVRWLFLKPISPDLLGRVGFWRLVGWALLAYCGKRTVIKREREAFSIGSVYPDERLWREGWKVGYAGKVLGQTVLFYESI